MMTFCLRYFPLLLLAGVALLGLALGHLGASIVGVRLAGPGVPPPPKNATPVTVARPLTLGECEVIVQKSLFAPQLAGKYSLSGKGGDEEAPSRPRANLVLLGTIAGGLHPLALVRLDAETRTLHVGDTLPDNGKVVQIARQLVKLRYADGTEQVIVPPEIPPTEVPATVAAAGGSGTVRSGGDNRWAISRDEADKARSNLGELLKQARMEPHIVNGKTDGFEVKMVKPNTIFTALGLQKGDIVKQVNGLALDSPEKALQIFQQLREARHIVVALERGGTPMSFEYDLD